MLSGVLKSDRAAEVNVAIMRAFVQLRRESRSYEELKEELGAVKESLRNLEHKYDQQAGSFQDAVQKLLSAISSQKVDSSRYLVDSSNFPQKDASVSMDNSIGNVVKNAILEKGPSDFEVIEKAVEKYYGLKTQDLRSLTRMRTVSLARQIAMYLVRKQSGISFREIAVYFGRKDHTTVLHAYRKIEVGIAQDKKIRDAVKSIQNYLLKLTV